MTLTALRFNTNVSPLVQAVQERRLLQALLEGAEGKLGEGTAFEVNPSSGKTVRIEPCTSGQEGLIINGTESALQGAYHVYLDAVDTSVTLDAAPSTNNRIDLVLCMIDDAEYSGATYAPIFTKLTGTESSSPVAPDPDAAGIENYHVLAQVLRTPGEPATLAASAFTQVTTRLYTGTVIPLAEATGDGTNANLRLDIPQVSGYRHLKVIGRPTVTGTSGTSEGRLRFNSDTAGKYHYSYHRADSAGGVITAVSNHPQVHVELGTAGSLELLIPNWQSGSAILAYQIHQAAQFGTSAANLQSRIIGGRYEKGAGVPLTEINIFAPGAGVFFNEHAILTLYGMR